MEEQRGNIWDPWTIHRVTTIAVVVLGTSFGAVAGPQPPLTILNGPGSSVMLAWDRSPDASVSGYRIYQGTNSGNYTLVYDAGNGTNTTVPVVQSVVYFFAATAYDTNGMESGFSAEVSYTNSATGTGAPAITNFVKTADGNFSVSGFGLAGQSCVLLATTNLAPPLTWKPISTNAVDLQGSFSFVDLDATNYTSRLYQVLQTGPALGPILGGAPIPLAAHR